MSNRRKPLSAEVRLKVLTRDKYTCCKCGKNGSQVELQVDHIHPVARGGSNHPSNLQTLCRACNQRKGAKFNCTLCDSLRPWQHEHQDEIVTDVLKFEELSDNGIVGTPFVRDINTEGCIVQSFNPTDMRVKDTGIVRSDDGFRIFASDWRGQIGSFNDDITFGVDRSMHLVFYTSKLQKTMVMWWLRQEFNANSAMEQVNIQMDMWRNPYV